MMISNCVDNINNNSNNNNNNLGVYISSGNNFNDRNSSGHQIAKSISSNQASTFNSIVQQQQQQQGGKLVYLDKKFARKSDSTSINESEPPQPPPLPALFSSSKQCKQQPRSCECSSTNQNCNCKSVDSTEDANNRELLVKQKKRLSCEELENLKERFVDFIKLDTSTCAQQQQQEQEAYDRLNAMQRQNQQQSRLSVLSAESSSAADSSSSSLESAPAAKPEPPQRTVSIRNSTCNIYSSSLISTSSECYYQPATVTSGVRNDDCLSLKSNSIYSSCRLSTTGASPTTANCLIQPVRSSRSVFSIYEEEDESCSAVSSNSSSAASSSLSGKGNYLTSASKLERLSEFELKKIESMYRSIGSVVNVSSCTCDLFSTTSEQIANLLNDCWKLELGCMVPVWLLDTGFNPKRAKQLRLLFVDRRTAFPLIKKPIVISTQTQVKNPNGDKRLTFTLQNKQLVCLLQFYDFLSCHEFFKFFTDLLKNARYACLFDDDGDRADDDVITTKSHQQQQQPMMMGLNNNNSRSMMSLRRFSQSKDCLSESQNRTKKMNRYSELITTNASFNLSLEDNTSISSPHKIKYSSKTSNGPKLKNSNQYHQRQPCVANEPCQTTTTITKHCISNPCAFQHINSLKDGDQHIKLLIETFGSVGQCSSSTSAADITLNSTVSSSKKSSSLVNSKSFKKK